MQLYLAESHTLEEIAQKVGCNEKTIRRWKTDYKWDEMRKGLMVTKQEILRDLYDTLAAMKTEAKKLATDDDPSTKPDTDGIYKLALAIKKLETQTGIGDIINVAQRLTTFVKQDNLADAQLITKWFDLFIQSTLKGDLNDR